MSVLKVIDEDEDVMLLFIYDRLKEIRSWIKGVCVIGEVEDLDKIICKEMKLFLVLFVSIDVEVSEVIVKCFVELMMFDMFLLYLGDI